MADKLKELRELSEVYEAHFVNECRRDVVAVSKDLLKWAVEQIESDRRYRERLSEAFNSGDGSYHP